ncbi:hypothetical protein RA307_11670 [Xanthobacteraceae bacterium Astr-EGSB]|uniref:hypothetical protein n=1 Tax=Astrobacterium formosum TaxID=3069710 RepID=UPI0027B8234E|nr:hypothetical protein [Xanthobacteraceae bacterium Astr-EGSB]
MTNTRDMIPERSPTRRESFDLDALLHPAKAFLHPSQVVHDPDLTRNEKRAILASWASDACAIEAAPDLRTAPSGPTVRFDDIMDALRTLDGDDDSRRWRKTVRRRQVFDRPRSGRDFGLS